jgi:molybdenum cofactor cytidylyltransferase
MAAAPRFFAIIPAAGESRRMGQPKLLLPVRGKPLVAHTIEAWLAAGLKPFVIVRQGDAELADVCRACGAAVIQPQVDPPEMKASVLMALEHVANHVDPQAHDAWLLAPADMPELSVEIIRALLSQHEAQVQNSNSGTILVPTLAGKRGHPVLFPWLLANEVATLAADEGINALLERYPFEEISCNHLPHDNPFADVDTPTDYERYRHSQ